jgi:hypothetical protein
VGKYGVRILWSLNSPSSHEDLAFLTPFLHCGNCWVEEETSSVLEEDIDGWTMPTVPTYSTEPDY